MFVHPHLSTAAISVGQAPNQTSSLELPPAPPGLFPVSRRRERGTNNTPRTCSWAWAFARLTLIYAALHSSPLTSSVSHLQRAQVMAAKQPTGWGTTAAKDTCCVTPRALRQFAETPTAPPASRALLSSRACPAVGTGRRAAEPSDRPSSALGRAGSRGQGRRCRPAEGALRAAALKPVAMRRAGARRRRQRPAVAEGP